MGDNDDGLDTNDHRRRPSRNAIRRIVAAGSHAPLVLLEEAIETMGGGANAWADRARAKSPGDIEALAAAIVKSHVRLARLQGAALGAALTALELSPAFGPAGELPASAALLGIATDITTIAWLQARLLLHLAAIYGHDAMKPDRLRELGVFFGVTELMHEGGKRAAGLTRTAAGRLILRHLRGDVLVAVKALFRMVGVKFARKRLLELVPLVNIPVLADANGVTVAQLGAKARNYYRDLPEGF